jgi:hypothetical protein
MYAGISRAHVSKAKPQRGPAGHRGTRTPAGGHRGGRQAEASAAAARHTGCRSSTAEEEGRGPPPRRIRARGTDGGGESGRGAASGRGATSGRCASGGRWRDPGRRRRETVLRACQGGLARRVEEGRRGGEEGRVEDGRGEDRRR